MQSLYKIKTAKFFEKVKKADVNLEEDPFSITNIVLCTESRILAVVGASSYVMMFKYQKKEKATETKFMEIPIVYEVSNLSHGLEKKESSSSPSSGSKQHFEFPPRPLLQVASQSSAYTDPMDAFNFDKPTYEYFTPLRLRPGAQKKAAGYHAELVRNKKNGLLFLPDPDTYFTNRFALHPGSMVKRRAQSSASLSMQIMVSWLMEMDPGWSLLTLSSSFACSTWALLTFTVH